MLFILTSRCITVSSVIKDKVLELQEMYREDGYPLPPPTPTEICSAILIGWSYRTDTYTVPNSGSACALVGDGMGGQGIIHFDRVSSGNVCTMSGYKQFP